MPVNYQPAHLSATPNGGVVEIPLIDFLVIHTSPTGTHIYDELYINLFYHGTSDVGTVKVRLNTTDPNLEMTFLLVSGTVTPIFRGHRISNAATIAIQNIGGGRVLCFGNVNRITIT